MVEELNTTISNDNDTEHTPVGEEGLKKFIRMVEEEKIGITTGFIADPVSGILTHQVLQITCGDYTTVSHPEALAVPLKPVDASELSAHGETIN